MKRLLSITLVIAAGLLSVFGAVPAPESLLANDTLLVLTIPDYTKAHATWAQGPTFRLWDDPAVKPFRDKFTAKLKSEYIEPLEKELGIKLPSQLKVQVHPESADTMHLVLPHVMTPTDLQALKATADQAVVAAGNTGATAIQFGCCC